MCYSVYVMKFQCPHCSQNIEASYKHYGTSVPCPTCGGYLTVPVPTPVIVYDNKPVNNASTEVTVSYILMGLLIAVSCIPFVGFGVWIVALPVLLICLILGGIATAKNNDQGIFVILCSVLAVPMILLVTPFIGIYLGFLFV